MAVTTSSGESILFETRQHPIVFAGPALVFLLGLIMGRSGGLFIAIAVIWALATLFDYLTALYTVTTHRLVCKWGIFGRHSVDLRISQVNMIQEKTSLLGLIFGAFGMGYANMLITPSSGNPMLVTKVFRPKEFIGIYQQAHTDLEEGTRGLAAHAQQRAAVAGAAACACGQLNPAGTAFCGGCGKSLGAQCPACGELSTGRFCGKCGADTLALPAGAAPQELGA